MALVYALCVLVALCAAVQSRSLLDSASRDPSGVSEDTLLRARRNIVNGNEIGQGCPVGSIRKGKKCMSCHQIGRIHNRHLKFCNNICIDVRLKCTQRRTYA